MDPVKSELSRGEMTRYEGHLNLPGVGLGGQEKLKKASVLCIGVGGLGCPVATYLVAAGVGRIGLVDSDVVEESNLQRQTIFGTSSVGQKKAEFAKRYLEGINPHMSIIAYPIRLTEDWVESLFPEYDIIIDATDNFATRVLINSGSIKFQKPLISGSVFRFEGQVSVFNYQNGPCYECLFPMNEEDVSQDQHCTALGIVSSLTGIVGTIQANEAIKLILGVGEPLSGKLLLVDALEMKTQHLSFSKRSDCPRCQLGESRKLTLGSSNSPLGLKADELLKLVKSGTDIHLIDVRPSDQVELIRIPGSQKIGLEKLIKEPEAFHHLKERNVVIYCGSELRARRGAEALREYGISARYLIGGLREWTLQGLPLEEVE